MIENKDISIGEGEWIKWRQIDATITKPYNIDPFLKGSATLWENLETECVAACCGIDAFALWPADITKACKDLDKAVLKDSFVQVINQLQQIEDKIVVSRKLNNLFDKQVFIHLIKHLMGCL